MIPPSDHRQPRKRPLPRDGGKLHFLDVYSDFLQTHIQVAGSPDQTGLLSQAQTSTVARGNLDVAQSLQAIHADSLAGDRGNVSPSPPSVTVPNGDGDGVIVSMRRYSPVPFRTLRRDPPPARQKGNIQQLRQNNQLIPDDGQRPAHSRFFKKEPHHSDAIVKDGQKPSAPFGPIPTMLDSSLDPFFALPDNMVLNPNQKAYIHLYFQELSPIVFGTTPQALYCPRYTVGYHTARVSPAGIMWLIVVAMQCANMKRGLPSDRALQSQIQTAFAHLHVAIQDAQQNPVGVCLALMFANLAEIILGTHRLQGLYTTAIESVVEAAGGLKRFLGISPLPGVYLAAVYTFLSHRPRSLTELETVKLRWISSMVEIQQQLLRIWQSHHIIQARSQSIVNSAFTNSTPNNVHDDNRPYTADDSRCFSAADQDMMPLIRAMIIPGTATDYMPHTTAIYLMHELIWALVDFGGHPERMKTYHKRLKFLIRHSLVGGGQVVSTSYMAGGMAALIVARARQETYEDVIGVEDEDVKLERTRASIDSLKMYAALRESGRNMLLDTFRSWVLDIAEVSSPIRVFSDEATAALGSEALENWFESVNLAT